MKGSIWSFIFLLAVIVLTFTGCDKDIKNQNIRLKQTVVQLEEKVNQLEKENAELKSTISKLGETDNYYYQLGVSNRKSKNYQESNKYLEEMIERFPRSPLVIEAKKLIKNNTEDILQDLYDRALAFQKQTMYEQSNRLIDELLTRSPKSSLAYKAKQIKASNNSEMKERDAASEKAGSDLELLNWSWSESYGYVEAKGQVKNISGRSLRNVEAIVSFYDANGDFITSGSALIEYNPVLAGQISPFTVMETYNPAMKKATVQFKFFGGGTIPTYYEKK